MNILYCGDKNIADGLIISVLSLLRNVCVPLNIYVLTMRFENGDKIYEALPEQVVAYLDRRVKTVNSESSVCMIDVSDLFRREVPMANLETRFTPCCMLRLLADCIPQLPEKILYLDNDVICRLDCTAFYEQGIAEYEICGVLDYYGRWFFRRNIFKLDYLNSGVLLLNLAKIRETGLFKKCRERCQSKKMFMPDQSAINKLSQSKKIYPRKYNEQRRLHPDTVFQHFTTSFRLFPWVHTVTVKPWQTEKVHKILKLYEYDDLLNEYSCVKKEIYVGGNDYEK